MDLKHRVQPHRDARCPIKSAETPLFGMQVFTASNGGRKDDLKIMSLRSHQARFTPGTWLSGWRVI